MACMWSESWMWIHGPGPGPVTGTEPGPGIHFYGMTSLYINTFKSGNMILLGNLCDMTTRVAIFSLFTLFNFILIKY